jgi:hypothetical protein
MWSQISKVDGNDGGKKEQNWGMWTLSKSIC